MKKIIYFIIIISTIPLLTGCDRLLYKLLSKISGEEVNTVILSEKPISLNPKTRVFNLNPPAKVYGNDSKFCMILESDLPLNTQEEMDNIFSTHLGNTNITATLKLSDGKTIEFDNPLQAWRKYGVIFKNEEVSACIHLKKGNIINVNDEIVEVSLNSTNTLKVKGIYWESTNFSY